MKKIIPIILVIVLPLYILLFSLEVNTFNLDMFSKHIEENNIEAATGKEKEYLMEVSKDLLEYLKGKDVDLSIHFNEREVAHMVDVERLFQYGFILKKILFILIALSTIFIAVDRENLRKNLDTIYKGTFIWWIIIVLLFILSMFDFTKYFTYFHLIFFDNDLWLLDPRTDMMIQMLPEVFFINIFIKIVAMFLLGLVIFHGGVYILRKRNKKLNLGG